MLISFTSFSQSAYDHVQNGIALYNIDNYKGAIEEINRALALEPTNAEAYLIRGNAYYSLGEFGLAVSDYETARKLGGNMDFVWEYMGNAHHSLGKDSLAIAEYDMAIALNRQSARLFESRARAKHERGLYKQAIADYDTVLILDPSHNASYMERGLSKTKLGLYKAAEVDYTVLISLNNNPYAYYNRGHARLMQKNYAGAIEDLTISVDSIGIFYDAMINRGDAYYALGKYDEAILDYTEVIKMKHDEAYLKRGNAKSKLKDKKGACDDWSMAAKSGNAEAAELVMKKCK